MTHRRVMSAVLMAVCVSPAGADPRPVDAPNPTADVSPVLSIEHPPGRATLREAATRSRPEWARSMDGRGNNLTEPDMGAAVTPLLRMMDPEYGDGVSALAGPARPGPRAVSNAVCAQSRPRPNAQLASDFLWQWGQFLDHDIDLTDGADPPEPANVPIPQGDPFFDPDARGDVVMPFNRSIYDAASGTDPGNPRQQLNEITAWIDASNVYGSDEARASVLRALDGTGRLSTSAGDLLPFNVTGLPNAGGSSPALFVAGDVRANEQVGLTAMHTLFVREHNRLSALIAAADPSLDDDGIYERARQIVGAEVQVITYREYLPALLGPDALAPYAGYQPGIDARILNLFSTGSYRYGHSALSPTLLRLDVHGERIGAGNLALRDAFFSPSRITDEGGIEPLLRGLASQFCQAIDPYVVDEVRNFLFGPPGAGGFDLAALNIQRGRDHGLPSYNHVRAALGLPPASSFAEISSDPEIRARLAAVYAGPDDVDLWVGGLAEDRLPQGMVGPLIRAILVRQFEALRDGDRFWYVLTMPPETVAELEATRLSDIIRRNATIAGEIQDDVFHIRATQALVVDPDRLSWAPDAQASGYQLVRGDLGLLRASGGDFGLATDACVADLIVAESVLDDWVPSPGEGEWYLVRSFSRGIAGPSTYNTGFASQAGFRDEEIAASGVGCRVAESPRP